MVALLAGVVVGGAKNYSESGTRYCPVWELLDSAAQCTVANVSKVGSFTQSGATNVACGFTGDTPALIILKRTDDTGDWYLFDSTRGIVAGNDKSKYLNTNAAQITNADVVDPYSGGFATTSSLTTATTIGTNHCRVEEY